MFKSPVKSKKKSQHQTKLKIIQCVLKPVLIFVITQASLSKCKRLNIRQQVFERRGSDKGSDISPHCLLIPFS